MSMDFKHKQLEEKLRFDITGGVYSAGQKIPSENELSQQLSVSRQTVRQAISTLEREGLLLRVRGSGTFVQSTRLRKSNGTKRIGVIITYLDDYVFPSIVQGIEKVLAENGYSMTLGITYNKVENERKVLLQMLESGVDGLIVEGTKSALPNPNISIYEQMRKENLPFLFINGYYENIGNGYVIIDDVQAGSVICEELIANGHIAIGGVFKSDDMQGHKRYEGFMTEINRHGLTVQDESVIWYTTEDIPYLFGGDIDTVLLTRLASTTGVVCYNDLIAIKLMEAFRRNHRIIPEDCSFVSVDNSALASSALNNLTSYQYPGSEIGSQASEGLLKLLDGREKQVRVKLNSQLIRRGSVRTL